MTEATQADTAPATADTAPAGEGANNTANPQAQTAQDTATDTGKQRASLSNDENPNVSNDDPNTTNAETPAGDSDFALPDEYKEKSWADKVKSQDDLYRQLDNLSGLVGKKTILPIDYESATPEEITEHHKALAPEKGLEAYGFKDINDPLSKATGEAFLQSGITEHQGKAVLEVVREAMGAQVADDTSEDGYLTLAKESFGDDHETSIKQAETLLKANASEEDKKFFDSIDNKARIALDRTVNNVAKSYEARIQAVLKEHGVKESGAQTDGNAGSPAADVKDVRSDLRNQIIEMSKGDKPYTAQDKQALIDKLNSTYK